MNEFKMKHLELIQTIITRMATNSFMIKGWSITLVSALFALAAKDADARYVIISYFPVSTFWLLDGYYLFQETLFRRLYDKARDTSQPDSNFSMDTTGLEGGKASWGCAVTSKTILLFHIPIFSTVTIVMIWLCRRKLTDG